MKAQNLFKKITLTLFIFASLLTLQSFKNTSPSREKKTSSVSSQVSYIGEDDQYFLFEVVVSDKDSSLNNAVRISIRANNQDDIFDEHYRPGSMTKIFKINKTDIEKISFCILSRHRTVYYHFDIERFYKEQVNVVKRKLN